MKQQKGISTTLSILLIVLLVVIVGGVVAYKYYSIPEKQPSNGELGEAQDETADWKTYRNEDYGFEVKYPPDWKVVDDEVYYFGFDERDFDVCFGLGCMAPGIVIGLHPNDNIETFWLWEVIQEEELLSTIKVIKKEVVTIRNREITKALLANGLQQWYYLFDSPEIKGFTLFSANTAKRDQIVYDLIAEKMLSTFRFIREEEPYIKILLPDGGEEWVIGEEYIISWQIKDSMPSSDAYVNIFLEKEGVVEFGRINKFGELASQVPFTWDVTQYFIETQQGDRTYHWVEPGNGYKIRLIYVWDTKSQPVESAEDFSDNYFSIIEAEEMADWKTYRNEEYGFEFKYPKDRELSETFSSSDIFAFGVKGPEQQFLPIKVRIQKELNKLYVRENYPEFYWGRNPSCYLDIITSFEISEDFNQRFEKHFAPYDKDRIEDIKIGEEKAMRYQPDVAPGHVILIWLLKNDKGMAFISSQTFPEGCDLNRILSTFRFLE